MIRRLTGLNPSSAPAAAAPARLRLLFLENVPLLLFAALYLSVGLASPRFLEPRNLLNILIQSSSVAIVAVGQTFVLLTAGVDLSVGAVMFVSAAVAGKMVLAGQPLWLALAAVAGVGLLFGALNGLAIVRLRVIPFVVTLATLYMGRGLGTWITETRAMNLPESLLQLGTSRIAGIPAPVLVLALVLAAAHLVLTRTPFGRQIYAVGSDRAAAEKAGVRTGRVLAAVYCLSGLCAAVGGMVAVAQLGAVSPTFGRDREFSSIAIAVLGGTSLFGGRGNVFPGALLGAVLIQSIENALVILQANVYAYPLVTAGVIFLAVLLDSLRRRQIEKLGRRKIRAG